MKRTLSLVLLLVFSYSVHAQLIKNKKYPSLLWEITGNGLTKPSYLFGTMHVSNKMAFNLADSFYLGIRSADVVALETNPESWQEDMSKYEKDLENFYGGQYTNSQWQSVSDYLTINTLKYRKYETGIASVLYSNPSVINSLLYRSYGNASSDFEEDTYLDMYIYQCGKRWGKKVAGVESYGESMKLMMEAYRDAAKEKNKKERSYDYDEQLSPAKLQEAYRKGDLDLLDSINRVNSTSDAFDEKFLYKRNQIQAESIDSILRKKLTLFVGVGAAHLPGQRGVIEMLRAMGYKLRPVKMGVRNSDYKNTVEKIRVPVNFTTQTSADGFYKVDVPGKLYETESGFGVDQRQFADMANGSYYMVTRMPVSAWLWGNTTSDVEFKVDSLLYENVPGRIISKTTTIRNGYKMIDLTNKTRRGDIQRYNIYITDFEIVFFKMSGNAEYVSLGEEAKRFFNSVQLKEFKSSPNWQTYSPAYGGFSVSLPHDPYTGKNGGNKLFDAEDKSTNSNYRVIRTDIHNYMFAEEDSFDLSLMEESFASSEFIDTLLSRKQTVFKKYPALDCQYRDKKGQLLTVRYLIQGPHYYTLVSKSGKETAQSKNFFNSFEILPFKYGEAKLRTDTSLYFTVKSPVFPEEQKDKLQLPSMTDMYSGDAEESPEEKMEEGVYRSKIYANDTTGEKVHVTFYKMQRYYYSKDSLKMEQQFEEGLDSNWIIRYKKADKLANGMRTWEVHSSDTNSSRMMISKAFYKNGVTFALQTETDTLNQPSAFIRSFFETFQPADTLRGYNPFMKKSGLFFDDFMSADTVRHKRAVKNIAAIDLDETDLPLLQKAINSLNWSERRYLATKKALIAKAGVMRQKETTDYLKQLYYAANDTVDLQYEVLEAMASQKTQYAYNTFRDMVAQEPPVIETGNAYVDYGGSNSYSTYGYGAAFLYPLFDSLQLTRTILPDLLPLINLKDYEPTMNSLLKQMVDSGLVKPKLYQAYFKKYMLEASQELKRQAIIEKRAEIEKAEKEKEKDKSATDLYGYDYGESLAQKEKGTGNDKLMQYATLLMPYWSSEKQVPVLLQQMLNSSDKRLKYESLLLMVKNEKPYNDTLLRFFAQSDDYRYELYNDLNEMDKLSLFPAKYNNHLDLAKSSLYANSSSAKPDTMVYLDRLEANVKGQKGYVYFYKYRAKKDDLSWKLATVGLVPLDSTRFLFEEKEKGKWTTGPYSGMDYEAEGTAGQFTQFTEVKLKDEDEEPLNKQLQKQLKKYLYSIRPSARQFYGYGDNEYGDIPIQEYEK